MIFQLFICGSIVVVGVGAIFYYISGSNPGSAGGEIHTSSIQTNVDQNLNSITGVDYSCIKSSIGSFNVSIMDMFSSLVHCDFSKLFIQGFYFTAYYPRTSFFLGLSLCFLASNTFFLTYVSFIVKSIYKSLASTFLHAYSLSKNVIISTLGIKSSVDSNTSIKKSIVKQTYFGNFRTIISAYAEGKINIGSIENYFKKDIVDKQHICCFELPDRMKFILKNNIYVFMAFENIIKYDLSLEDKAFLLKNPHLIIVFVELQKRLLLRGVYLHRQGI